MTDKIEFGVRIAGVPFLIRTRSQKIREFFRDYVEELPGNQTAPVLEASPEDLARAEKRYRDSLILEGQRASGKIGSVFLEQMAMHEKMTMALLSEEIYLMHGSALCMDGMAYIFTAPSGTGKSTHARLWREIYKDRVRMINDDKPYIRRGRKEEPFMVFGSPWRGKHGLGSDAQAPLGGICFLHRDKENRIERTGPGDALVSLLPQIYRPDGREEMVRTLSFAGDLLERIPVYDLYCNMDPSAARLSHDVMTGLSEGNR